MVPRLGNMFSPLSHPQLRPPYTLGSAPAGFAVAIAAASAIAAADNTFLITHYHP